MLAVKGLEADLAFNRNLFPGFIHLPPLKNPAPLARNGVHNSIPIPSFDGGEIRGDQAAMVISAAVNVSPVTTPNNFNSAASTVASVAVD